MILRTRLNEHRVQCTGDKHREFIIKGKRRNLEASEKQVSPLPCDLFLDSFSVGLGKKVQHGAAEVVSVAIWVPQLICNGI